jgi:putative flippase GtrA
LLKQQGLSCLCEYIGNLRWVFTDVQSRLDSHVAEVVSKLKELQAK